MQLTYQKTYESEEEDYPIQSDEDASQILLNYPNYPAPPLESKLYYFRLPNALHLEHRQFNRYII
jgi:hypothetical protein